MTTPKFIAKIESDMPAHKLAVLIDADNTSAKNIEGLLAEIARLGEATIKRIYGDFTSQTSASWKQVLNKFAISPAQQFAYTTGKNATDSKMIIDAMDILHRGNIDGFCLVSSDSDFTGLANRIREEGLIVYGFGKKHTPESFRNACIKFFFVENLNPPSSASEINELDKNNNNISTPKQDNEESVPASNSDKIPIDLLKEACDKNSDDTGWTHLGTLGSYLNKVKPDFDSRTFGHKKLKDLFLSLTEYFVYEERKSNDPRNPNIYVRIK